MSYTLLFHPAVRKDLRRLNPQARKMIVSEVLPSLAANPLKGIRLTGFLKKIWKYRVAFFGVWYRIAYQVDFSRKEVIILAIGSRGGFYDRLNRRLS